MSENLAKSLMFFGLVSFFGWVILFSGMAAKRKRNRRAIWETTPAQGTVAEYVSKETYSRKRGKGVYYLPVIAFEAEGKPYRLEYTWSVSRERYPEGTQVEVLYNINDPTQFHLASDEAFSHGGGTMMKFGAIWIVASLLLTLALAVFVGGATKEDFLPGRKRAAVTAAPVQTNSGYLYRLKSDNTALLTGYTGREESLTVPVFLEAHVVSEIGSQAFANASKLRKVTVPGRFSRISPAAFSGCLRLGEVVMEEGVSRIEMLAFGMCPNLKSVTIPESVKSIDNSAFPEDCGAVFHVRAGTAAEAFCRKKGYTVSIADP